MQTTVCKCVSCIWKQCHSPHAMPNLLFVFVVYGCIQVTCQWPHNPVTDCGALMHRFCGGTASEQPNWLLEQCAVRQWVVTQHTDIVGIHWSCQAGCSKHILPRHRQWQTTLPAGCAWPGHPTAGSGWRPETPADDLDHTHTPAPASHRACAYKEVQTEDICGLIGGCSKALLQHIRLLRHR